MNDPVYFIYELAHAGWFILALILAVMFGWISVRAWWLLGYGGDETRAAISLFVVFVSTTVSRGWQWLNIWLPAHGYHETALVVFNAVWVPFLAAVVGLAGGFCALRAFYPRWHRRRGDSMLFGEGAVIWVWPLLVLAGFLLITTFV